MGVEQLKGMYQRTGAPLHTAYAPVQLRDLYSHNNNNDGNGNDDGHEIKVKRWLSIAGICISRWTRVDPMRMPLSYSEASWSGMLDFRTGKWDQETLDLLSEDCRKSLPDVRNGVFELVGNGNGDGDDNDDDGITNPYLLRWPEMASTNSNQSCRFFSGFGDGACANIGTKCTSMDRIAVTIGTSAAARICLPLPLLDGKASGSSSRSVSEEPSEPLAKKHKTDSNASASANTNSLTNADEKNGDGFIVPFGLFCYRIDRDTILLGGALTDGGSVIAWLRGLFNLQSESAFMECLQKANSSYSSMAHHSNSHEESSKATTTCTTKDLVIVPFLSGERSTGYRENANGCIMGLSRSTTSADLIQESMESVILRINAIVTLIQTASSHIASSSHHPMKKCADACIITSGNALEKNELWRQMLADCSNMSVFVDSETSEGTSRGAMLLTANMLRNSSSTTRNLTITDADGKEEVMVKYTSVPNKSSQKYWTMKKEKQESFIGKMEPLWNQY